MRSLDFVDLMERVDLHKLVTLMVGAGGPPVIPARVRWPLHRALRDLHEDAARRGLLYVLPEMSFRPCPEVAVHVDGANAVITDLVRRRMLVPDGRGRSAVLRVDPAARAQLRRELMRLPVELSMLVQRAAARWAALVETSAKNRSTDVRSSVATVASSTPKRRDDAPPGILSTA